MNNAFFRKAVENVKNRRDIKLAITEARSNYLVSEPNHHTTKTFSDNLIATQMKITHILMNKTAYLGLSISKITKIVIFEVWYDYVEPKYCEKAKSFYMDTDSSIVYIKTENI